MEAGVPDQFLRPRASGPSVGSGRRIYGESCSTIPPVYTATRILDPGRHPPGTTRPYLVLSCYTTTQRWYLCSVAASAYSRQASPINSATQAGQRTVRLHPGADTASQLNGPTFPDRTRKWEVTLLTLNGVPRSTHQSRLRVRGIIIHQRPDLAAQYFRLSSRIPPDAS